MIARATGLIVILLCGVISALSQANFETPVAYMDYLSNREEELSKKYLSYISEVAHGGKARKMERRREDVIAAIRESIKDANRLRPYKGDASLRDAYKDYWNVLLSVFTEDYHKIVDMEEVAERSYDAMEAYLLMQEKANQRLDAANDGVRHAFESFAAQNNVTLVEGNQTRLKKKLAQAGKVNAYLNKLFLIYFKSSVQERLMIEALSANDVNAVEQTRSSMLKYAEEGLTRLDTVKSFNGDGSLLNACRKVLEFHRQESSKVSPLVDFMMQQPEFEKQKKTYDAKPQAKRTQQDVDQYNKMVAEYNKGINDYNKLNQELNTSRSKVMTHWDTTRKKFMDHHFPYKM